MPRLLSLLLSTVLVPSNLGPQARADAPADVTVYAVTYIDVMPSSRGTATAALKQFRDASRKQQGCLRLELFEQMGRPAHFAIVETWRDQQMFDARDAVQKQLLDALQPIRVSDYDQRPYKTLTVGSAALPAPNSQAISVVTHVDTVAAPQAPALLKRLAEASRREEGNVRFDVVQHAMRANHFTVIETWQNQKALDAHAAAAHTRQYRDELHPVTGSPIDERVYKAVQ